ncbi:MAG: LysR substrate-binding domain-containing protein [Rhodobacteraceae bacterium]|nr:LysR substrate-binding domain-containing protein [Paracoccaceae bacterium]
MQIKNINSVQVFGVVAHVLNVTRAAQTLHISQSSVSYHIKKLEADMGVTLFRRTPTGLELTEAGTLLSAYVDRGLAMIRTGMEKAVSRAGSVKLAVLPMFSSRWLSSRLGSLLEAHPELNLSIQSHNNSYARNGQPEQFADLGIQWGRGAWPDFRVTRLWPERLVVVCSPDYLRDHPIAAPADLETCTLLHVDDERMWAEWFANAGLTRAGTQPQMMLEDRHFQLSSTINGLGVSLFAEWLVQAELSQGALVDPFGHGWDTTFAYHLIHPRDAQLPVAAQVVHDWIMALCADRRAGAGPASAADAG